MTRWNTILSLTASSAVVASTAAMRPPPPPPPADPAIACYKGGDLVVMNADGSNATAIAAGQFYWPGPSWAPSGASIAYDDLGSIWRIDVAVVNGVPTGSNKTLLLSAEGREAGILLAPAWSPLGDEIVAFDEHSPAPGRLIRIPAAGGPESVIYTAPPGYFPGYPAWSPDGAYIAFVETAYGAGAVPRSIRILERATGWTTTVFGPQTNDIRFLDWARTQDVLAFTMYTPARNIYTLALTPGSTPHLVVANGTSASWSPDDAKIIFINLAGGNQKGVYGVTLATGAVQRITRTEVNDLDRRRF